MVYFAPITTTHSANVSRETDEPLKAQRHAEQPQTGNVQQTKLDDGYTVAKYSDGSFKIFDPNGKELSREEMVAYVNKMGTPTAKPTKTTAPKNVMRSTYVQNKGDNETVKKYSNELSNFGSQYVDMLRNRGSYGNGQFITARNKFVQNENYQKIFNECLGDPNQAALSMNGVIRLQDGMTLYMTRKQDMNTKKYYWDVQRFIQPKTES